MLRAAEMLYSIGERDLALRFVTALAESSADVTALVALAEITARYEDVQAMLLIGKTALARGLALDRSRVLVSPACSTLRTASTPATFRPQTRQKKKPPDSRGDQGPQVMDVCQPDWGWGVGDARLACIEYGEPSKRLSSRTEN